MGLLLIRAWRLVLPALLPGFSQAVGPTGWHLGPLLSLLTPQGMHELFCMRFGADGQLLQGLSLVPVLPSLGSPVRLGRAAFATRASYAL